MMKMRAEDKTRQEIISKLAQMQRRLSKQAALKAEVELARETLQELEDKYKALHDCSHVFIYVHDFKGKFLDANQAVLNLLGYQKQDLSTLNLSSLLGEDQLHDALGSLEELEQRAAQAHPRVYRLRKKDGEDVWVEAVSGVLYHQGKPYAIQVIAVDITERRRVEQELKEHQEKLGELVEERTAELENVAQQLKRRLEDRRREEDTLRQSEAKYRQLVEGSPLGFLIVQDLPPGVVFANHAAAEMLGYSLDQLMSLSPEDVKALVHPEDLSRLLAGYQDAKEGARLPKSAEARIIRRDGVERWVEVFFRRVQGREDRYLQVYFVDINEGKRWERERGEETRGREQVQEQKGGPKEAERKEPQELLLQTEKLKAVETLVGEVGHNFNELLTSIQEQVDLVLRKIDQRSPLYHDLKHIEDVSMGAANLVRQLLLFGGRQPMEFVTVNLNRMVEILSKMLNRIIGKDIALITKLEPDLWSVKADVASIEQVIVNLAMNARDAMPEGGKLGIQTENVDLDEDSCGDIPDARPGKFVCLSVTDTGTGMGRTTRSRIFEPFFSTKRQEGSAGLGLSVAYGIVKQHKGWIDVHSETGRGTLLKVFLPAHIVKRGDDNDEQRMPQEAQGDGW